ncbi:MAG: SpoIIIAH-like family protein [Ruminococcus sp.]|nr:SpoIIIAH-like family protein [Ruminococcus sp.]
MKKPSLIIGKKQIILSCLTLMLAIAIYMNYALSDTDLETAELVQDEITYGDTAFVDAQVTEDSDGDSVDAAAVVDKCVDTGTDTTEVTEDEIAEEVESAESAEDYFAQARLNRMQSRDESVATLQSILGGGDQTENELVTDAIAAVETLKLIESESTIESLIKAMGYTDCIVYLDSDSAKVVVQTDGLDTAQAAAIKDVILGEVSISTENIRIFEVA